MELHTGRHHCLEHLMDRILAGLAHNASAPAIADLHQRACSCVVVPEEGIESKLAHACKWLKSEGVRYPPLPDIYRKKGVSQMRGPITF